MVTTKAVDDDPLSRPILASLLRRPCATGPSFLDG